MFRPSLADWLGPPRLPSRPFDIDAPGPIGVASRRFADIAASVQAAVEAVILDIVRQAIRLTGIDAVCMAGGVALNSLANGRIRRELGVPLYVQPAAGDAGSAIGAAAAWYHRETDRPRMRPLSDVYLGSRFSDEAIDAAIRASRHDDWRILPDEDELCDGVARLLADGHVVGWFQHGAEWGPRALGHRSILADPRSFSMQRTVNEKIKYREPFRPFAPSVLAEHAAAFFDFPPVDHALAPEYFMLAVHPVRPEAKARIPAVSHVDGSARVHLVDRAKAPRFHRLIARFGALTGVPVLLNTSFNLRGEPIVDSPTDALRTFSLCDMDYLVLGNRLVGRGLTL
jgi:carbamoyltransferase